MPILYHPDPSRPMGEPCAPPLKDSGKRKEAGTGAVRDASDGKAQMFYLSPHVMPCPVLGQYLIDRDLAGLYSLFNASVKSVGWRRLCDHLDAGAIKYSIWNWAAGMPLSWVVSSYLRHHVQWMNGETDEDHAAARLCNLMFLLHYVEELDAGRLPAELDDLYVYETVTTDTTQEVAHSDYVEEYIKSLVWSPVTSDDVKAVVAGNIRAYANRMASCTEGTL